MDDVDSDPPAGRSPSDAGRALEVTRSEVDAVGSDTSPAISVIPAFRRARGPDDTLDDAIRLARLRAQLLDRHDSPVRVGRFALLRAIGRGGMGTVYEAYDPQLERNVAVKLWRTDDPDAAGRVLEEGRALARLVHPNVVTVHEVGTHGGEAFMVMELVRGPNVRAWMSGDDGTPRAWREVVAVFLAAAQGLAAAHGAGIRHGDIKPDNIVVGDDGRCRVVDFGVARGTEENARGSQAGTPAYMAPEQIAGGAVDVRADQYGFGVALFEALHLRRPDRHPPSYEPALPRWLTRLITRCLAPDPRERFPDMRAIARVLEDGLRARARRRLGATVITAGIAGLAWSTIERDPCAKPAAVASLETHGDPRMAAHAAQLTDLERAVCLAEHAPPSERPADLGERRVCLDEAVAVVFAASSWRDRHAPEPAVWPYAMDALDAAARCDTPPPTQPSDAVVTIDVRRRRGEIDWEMALAAAQARAGHPDQGLVRLAELAAAGDDSLAGRAGRVHLLEQRIALDDARVVDDVHLRGILWTTLADDHLLEAIDAATLLARLVAERDGMAAASTWFELADALCRRLGDPPSLRAALHLTRAHAWANSGHHADADAELTAAAAVTDEQDDAAMLALLRGRAAVYLMGRRWDAAHQAIEGALARFAARHGPDHPDQFELRRIQGIVLAGLGRLDEAIVSLDAGVADARGLLGPDHGHTIKSMRARCLALGQRDGPTAEGVCLGEVGAAYERVGATRMAATIRLDRAALLASAGARASAAELLRAELARDDPPRPALEIAAMLARVEGLAGRVDEGLAVLERHLGTDDQRSEAADVARQVKVELLLAAGRIDEANAALDDAMTHAVGDPIGFVARRGMIADARGQSLAALADLETALLATQVEVDVLGPIARRVAELRAARDRNDPAARDAGELALQLFEFAPAYAADAEAMRAWLAALPAAPPG